MTRTPHGIRHVFAGLAISFMIAGPSALHAQSINGDAYEDPLQDMSGRVRALIIPAERALISSEVEGLITQIPVHEGDAFKKGSTLVRFDCRSQKALLEVAEAELAKTETILESRRLRFERKSIGPIDLKIAEAEVVRQKAVVKGEQTRVRRCRIAAPFSGRVATRGAQPHEVVDVGAELLEIYAADSLELELIVPSVWLRWIRPDLPFRVKIDETGKVYDARVVRPGASVDPVSQTVKIQAKFQGNMSGLLPGMSGQAVFEGAPPS